MVIDRRCDLDIGGSVVYFDFTPYLGTYFSACPSPKLCLAICGGSIGITAAFYPLSPSPIVELWLKWRNIHIQSSFSRSSKFKWCGWLDSCTALLDTTYQSSQTSHVRVAEWDQQLKRFRFTRVSLKLVTDGTKKYVLWKWIIRSQSSNGHCGERMRQVRHARIEYDDCQSFWHLVM